eukprot:CAMPEP_0118689364 /NCGR_PEP_ID=MMETSP0800-20121206/9450_1 /TAXON_ID=210618 ORGANISM="Striatella unipunctata, Strain CCMP2910" /NCGR_SAMPLE_ID=MMETSP0800 /ASSEMBLY_ACC=CAM_ASM_000638 /LENGTH=244 /DNA_ID=CAMNT_0006586757 /DNA_START=81 /DNA_END=815 /DNA_ORIENTATION=-
MEKRCREELKRLQKVSDKMAQAIIEHHNDEDYFASCARSIKIEKARVQELLQEVEHFVGELQTVIYGNMCFELTGAAGKIETQQELQDFHELTKSAMEIACVAENIDADVVFVKVVKQEFESWRRSLLRTSLSLIGSNKKNYENTILRIGTVVGLLCNCKTDEPLSDVWSKRRRRRRLSEEETQHVPRVLSSASDLQARYVAALQHAFRSQKSSLANVVNVVQIDCETNGFLTGNPLDYILNFQ